MDRFPETTFTYGNFDLDEDGCLSEPVYQPEEESGPIMSLADCYLRNQCNNCLETAERLTASPDDEEFLLCDECMEEAVAIQARRVPVLMPITSEVAVANIPEWKVA